MKTTLSEKRPWLAQKSYEELERENDFLKDRCHALTNGKMCSKCNLICIHKDIDNDGQCSYEGLLGYDK